MDHRKLSAVEVESLRKALNRNVDDVAAILMDRRDTSFAGTADEANDAEVVNAIRSVPCHY